MNFLRAAFPRTGILRRETGQYIPITAMVVLSAVAMLIAAVNVQKVARAKLEAQGLADAIALAVATQEGRMMNYVVDRNNYLNQIFGTTSPARATHIPLYQAWLRQYQEIRLNNPEYNQVLGGHTPGTVADFPRLQLMPPLAFVQNSTQGKYGFLFNSKPGAREYAELVNTVNKIQLNYVSFYQSILNMSNSSNSRQGIKEMLLAEVPALREDPNLVGVYIYNADSGKKQSAERKATSRVNAVSGNSSISGTEIESYMNPIEFEPYDVPIQYLYDVSDGMGGRVCCKVQGGATLGGMLGSAKAGWMVLTKRPAIKAIDLDGSTKDHIGAVVIVVKKVYLGSVFGVKAVRAESRAVVSLGSGINPGDDPRYPNHTQNGGAQAITMQGVYEPMSRGAISDDKAIPIFKPKYWVRLADRR